jgi:hypothetical protein
MLASSGFATSGVRDRLLHGPAPSPDAEDDAGDDAEAAEAAARIVSEHPPGPLHDRSFIYISIGLLGVVLFGIAISTMAFGKATPVNLIIGLMGILFMTPAGGYFLLKWLNPQGEVAEG